MTAIRCTVSTRIGGLSSICPVRGLLRWCLGHQWPFGDAPAVTFDVRHSRLISRLNCPTAYRDVVTTLAVHPTKPSRVQKRTRLTANARSAARTNMRRRQCHHDYHTKRVDGHLAAMTEGRLRRVDCARTVATSRLSAWFLRPRLSRPALVPPAWVTPTCHNLTAEAKHEM